MFGYDQGVKKIAFCVILFFGVILVSFAAHAEEPTAKPVGARHMLLEVQTDEAVKQVLAEVVDDVRTSLRNMRIGYRGLRKYLDRVEVTISKPELVMKALQALRLPSVTVSTNNAVSGQFVLRLTETEIAKLKEEAIMATIKYIQIHGYCGVIRKTKLPAKRIGTTNRFVVQLTREAYQDLYGQKLSCHGVRRSELKFQKLVSFVPNDKHGLCVGPNKKKPMRESALLGLSKVPENRPSALPHIPSREEIKNKKSRAIVRAKMFQTLKAGEEWLSGVELATLKKTSECYVLKKRVLLNAENIRLSNLKVGNDGTPELHLQFGGLRHSRLSRYTGQKIAIVIDDGVIGTFTFKELLKDQTLVLRGGFSLENGRRFIELVHRIKGFVGVKIIREWTVSPGFRPIAVSRK